MPSYDNYSIRTKAEAERGLESVDQLARQAQRTFCYTVGRDDGSLSTPRPRRRQADTQPSPVPPQRPLQKNGTPPR